MDLFTVTQQSAVIVSEHAGFFLYNPLTVFLNLYFFLLILTSTITERDWIVDLSLDWTYFVQWCLMTNVLDVDLTSLQVFYKTTKHFYNLTCFVFSEQSSFNIQYFYPFYIDYAFQSFVCLCFYICCRTSLISERFLKNFYYDCCNGSLYEWHQHCHS